MDAKGFTLLELLAVVAILAIFATMLVARIGGRGEANLRQAEAIVLAMDAYARRLAEQRQETVSIRIDLNKNLLSVQAAGSTEPYRRTFPNGVSIDRAITPTESRSNGEVVAQGRADGASASYAIKLRSSHDATRWIVVAGGTGQSLLAAADDSSRRNADVATPLRDRDIEAFFRSLRPSSGADAP